MPIVERIDQYRGLKALLATWEEVPIDRQDPSYMNELRKKVRQVRNYIEHRADAEATVENV
jgi:hypothetical protein